MLKKAGEVVVGSDNKQYTISKLTVEEENLRNTVTKNTGKKIYFEIQDRSYKVALIPTIIAIATYFYYKNVIVITSCNLIFLDLMMVYMKVNLLVNLLLIYHEVVLNIQIIVSMNNLFSICLGKIIMMWPES